MTFEPYAVQCTTCNSRLRVTDPAIIGTIATCPSCNSMVEISAPISGQAPVAQQVAVGSSSVDSAAITEEAINADAGELVDPSNAPQGFTTDETTAAPQGEAEPLAGPMPPAWQSERTKRSRQVAMVVALAASGLLGAVLLFGWFVKNWNQEKVAQQDLTSIEEPASDVPSESPVESPALKTEVDASTTDSTSDDPPTADQVTLDQVTADQVPANQEAMPNEAGLTPAETAIDVPGLSPKNSDATHGDAIPSDLIPGGLIQDSPLDNMDTPLASKPSDEEADPEDIAPKEIPEGMQDLIQIIDLGGDQALPAMDAPPTLEDVEIESAAEETVDPEMIDNPPKPINFRSALAIELGLSSKDGKYPFSDLMLFLSQVSGVPIQIDWVTFDLVGINIGDGVVVERKGNSVGDIIKKVAASIGATVKQDESMITITPNDELVAVKLQQLLDLSDFADGQLSAISTLNAFFVGENNPGANAKELQVGPELGDKQVAVFAVEAMRRMRQLKPKIDDRVLLRWAQSASSESLEWPVITGGRPGQQISAPIAVAGMLRRISHKNDATCFVNWFDANRRKLSPKQLVMPHMGVDAGKVLTDILRPFELQVRQVDDSHWWLGTEATYDQFPVIVWTPPLGADQAIFEQRIKNAAAKNAAKNKSQFKFVIDPISGGALMLLPRFIVRQMPKIQNGLNLTQLK